MGSDRGWSGGAGWVDPAGLRALRDLVPVDAVSTPAGVLLALLRTAARRLRARRVTVPGTDGDLSLRLEALELRPDPVGLAVGQLDDIRIVAADLDWRGLRCHRLVLVCHNVHVRAGPAPAAVAAPVTVEVALRPAVVRERIAAVRPWARMEVGPDGGVRMHWSRRPRWGSLAVTPETTGTALHLQPRSLRLGRAHVPLPAWLPPVRIAVPALPFGLRLHRTDVGPDEIVLHMVADQWREAVPIGRLISLIARSGADA